MSPHRTCRSLAACLALTLGALAQDERKIPAPRPPVDLDHKTWAPASPVTKTPAKTGTRVFAAGPRPRPEPAKGAAGGALSNGQQFRLGLPRDQVVFDNQGGDAIWAEGANYKASFTGTGFTYVPFFGSEAPRNYPLGLELESVRLGADSPPLPAVPPRRQGHTVTLERGAVVERYDLRPDQVEQKFEIATPFRGDLTLALRVRTELRAERDAGGLRFGNALGHVGYTQAVLVDALGRRTAMRTDYADGRITLQAPASALADAAFPVTIDPVVTTFAVTYSGYVLWKSDIAFSNYSGHYLVVWVRVWSATDSDVHAVAVDVNGNPVPNSSSLIDNSSDSWDDCRVAACATNFLVVAARQALGATLWEIWGRTRSYNSATMGAQFQISGTETGDKVSPDVGGEFYSPAHFCVVWQRNYSATDHDIHYRLVDSVGGLPGDVLYIDNAWSNDDYRPRIAKSDGNGPFSTQAWPITWQRFDGVQSDVWAARVLWDGTLETPPFAIDANPTDNDTEPVPTSPTEYLGGAKYFLVAWTTDDRGDLDIYMRAYRDGPTPTYESSAFLGDMENLSGTEAARDQFLPQVDSDGCRFAVAYMERYSSSDRDAWVSTIELRPAPTPPYQRFPRAIDPRVTLTYSSYDTNEVGIVATRSGGGGSLDYGTVWSNLASGIVANFIDGAIYRGVTPGGGFATRATACGGMSISFAAGNQTPAPGAFLQFDLGGPVGPTLFILGAPAAALPLCPPAACALGATLIAAPPGPTLGLVVPCVSALVGSTFAVQGAAVATPGGCAGFGQLVTSDTVDVTIR